MHLTQNLQRLIISFLIILPSAHFQPPLIDTCQNGVDDVDFFAQTFLLLLFARLVPHSRREEAANKTQNNT